MMISKKTYYAFATIFTIAIIIAVILCFLNYLDYYIFGIIIGLTQIFVGLYQFSLAKDVNSKERNKGSKSYGIISLVLGIGFIIINVKTIMMH